MNTITKLNNLDIDNMESFNDEFENSSEFD
jgi:hypothetical protein